jgi:hypothetical protein
MTVLFKTRDMPLPTVIFRDDTFYEFLRTEPNMFEFETHDAEVMEFLTGMGYLTKGEPKRADGSYPAAAALPEPPPIPVPKRASVPKRPK